MRNIRSIITIMLAALLVLFSVHTVLAEEPTTPVSVEDSVDGSVEESVDGSVEDSVEESTVPEGGWIRYLETTAGASCCLIISGNETLLIIFDPDASELVSLLEPEGIDHLDSVILSFSEGECDLKELHEKYPIGHLYASNGNPSIASAGKLGIRTDYVEYLSVGDENVILYPDDQGSLGVLVFDENGSLFAADSMLDMSVLQDHPELAYISVLSISDKTGTDQGVITSMDPKAVIITGNIPDNPVLSVFYETEIAKTRTFFISHYTMDGISLDLSNLTAIQDAATLQMTIPDPELFVVPEEVMEGSEEGTDGENGEDGGDGVVTGKQTVAEAALKVWTGEIGTGQARTDTLRSEGFTDEEMQEVQRLVDKIASEHLGACTLVLFYAGDHAEDPEAQFVSIKSTATEPVLTSADEGYEFTGWYTDEECTKKFDFSTPIENKTKLYAGWKQITE